MAKLTIDNAAVGLKVICTSNPEWGVWVLGQDRNGWTVTAPQGSRMLSEGEFHFWHIAPKRMGAMESYLTALITEKGRDMEDEIAIEGHIGLTWQMLVDYIAQEAKPYHKQIRNMLVRIDFKNGDVFDYLTHLAKGMVAACGY